MNINGTPWRTIWLEADNRTVGIIDQTKLPHHFEIVRLVTADDAALAIRDMLVRGAPLIGAAAAWGLFLGLLADSSDAALEAVCAKLIQARPTAVNLRWAVERMKTALAPLPSQERPDAARNEAAAICEEDVRVNEAIGEHGLRLIEEQYRQKGRPINVLTHCNAGWLATVDWGTALAP
ncbi:S-methyl-5-thioribose-1-phosphate isomerase, partial [Desulfobulbus sp. F1]|nr:S-methyl-5-thioribose-1-phosphate isomerase [Desulfobulbus sp. F1]